MTLSHGSSFRCGHCHTVLTVLPAPLFAACMLVSVMPDAHGTRSVCGRASRKGRAGAPEHASRIHAFRMCAYAPDSERRRQRGNAATAGLSVQADELDLEHQIAHAGDGGWHSFGALGRS